MTGSARTAHVRIEGRVQGVGYRLWTQRTAVALGLGGFVRNRRDGSVEAVFHGPDEAVADMLKRCLAGPSGAAVTKVETLAEVDESFVGFEVRDTA
ncbi:acylphosphatase [Hyphomicrobium sp. CS1GBMeth3]|uniref:acylphosphatase n=1 Tax=Hyphomicrobium sp. CS1GBMeth3 TaxID=1892845 RepID=UPI000930FB28|nr:acylphosphatase [Hyphomicrobium sp. CS1GBMeth3]